VSARRQPAYYGADCAPGSRAVFRRPAGLVVGAVDRDATTARAIGVGGAVGAAGVAHTVVEGQARRAGTTGRIVVAAARGAGLATAAKLGVDAKAFRAVRERLTTSGFEAVLVFGAAWPAAAVVRVVGEHADAAAARRWLVRIGARAALVAVHFASGLALVCRRADLGARVERVRAAAGRTIVVRGAGLSTRLPGLVRVWQASETLAALGLRAAYGRVGAAQTCQSCWARAPRVALAGIARTKARRLLERHARVSRAVRCLGSAPRQSLLCVERRNAHVALELTRRGR